MECHKIIDKPNGNQLLMEKPLWKKMEGLSGPLAELRARIPKKHGNIQPMSRDELYDRSSLRLY